MSKLILKLALWVLNSKEYGNHRCKEWDEDITERSGCFECRKNLTKDFLKQAIKLYD